MKCSNCGKEFGGGTHCQHCGVDRVTGLANYNGYNNSVDSSGYNSSNYGASSKTTVCFACGEIIPLNSTFCPIRKRKWVCGLIALLVLVPAIIFGLYWGWKYYVLPEWPDNRECRTIEERAEKALGFARRHNMNEHYALFVDYSIPSGTPRLFVWDFHKKKIIASSYVMHGPGRGSTDERPQFSNKLGSECSSLGRFLVTKEHGNSLKRSFRIKGLDSDNQTAYARGLMIHGSTYLDGHCWMRYIPLHRASCQGCVTVSSRGMEYLWRLVNNESKPLLLWSFNG